MITKLDQAGIKFLIKQEGVVLHPYRDSNGTPTIGVGFTWYPDTGKHVTMQDKIITMQNCMDMLSKIIIPFEKDVVAYTKGLLNQNQFNAVLSFTYEMGTNALNTSTLLKKILVNPNDQEIKLEFLKWDHEHVDGVLKENPDIKARRQREINLYFTKE